MIKKRNMWMQVLLYAVTLGIYWFYQTSKEMIHLKGLKGNAGLWTVLYIFPAAFFFAAWKHGSAVDELTEGRYNKVLIFALWIFLPIAVWIITQSELNKLASDSSTPAPAAA
jgi:hypothetical protein